MANINQACNKFIYGRQNKLAHTYQMLWQDDKAYGIYFITGKSGSGKTTFLRSLFEPEKVSWYTRRELGHQIINGIQGLYELSVPETSIVFIEFLDELFLSEYAINLIKDLLKRWEYDQEGRKRLILCTFAEEQNVCKISGYPVIKISPVQISKNVVLAKAQEMGIEIRSEQLMNLSGLDTMLEVVSVLKMIELYNEKVYE